MSTKGIDWDFDGTRLTYGWCLALCYEAGFRGGARLRTAVAVICAESQRYTRAWHINYAGSTQESIDRGLFQINDKSHPGLTRTSAYHPMENIAYAARISNYGRDFRRWAAYNSGAYQKFLPIVYGHWLVGRWRFKTLKALRYAGKVFLRDGDVTQP